MSATLARTLLALAVLLGAAYLDPTRNAASAQDQEQIIRTGDFDGLWAGRKTRFSIQEIHDNGKIFDGVAEIVEGPLKGRKFGINGKIAKGNLFAKDTSLVLVRYVAGDTQIARVGPPKIADGHYIWEGKTTGIGDPEDGSWSFELRIPVK